MLILGISAFYHDSAAALIRDGSILAAAQEERFSRKKHDSSFPRAAVEYCLREGGVSFDELSYVVFYDKPFLKFERILETYLAFAPRGIKSFAASAPVWLKEKLFQRKLLQRELDSLGGAALQGRLLFTEHHQAHAASAFFASPFDEAIVLTMDGVGEWATTSVMLGVGSDLKPITEIRFPHSLGLLYSAFTYFTGFEVNSGEYKVMGLAPYGRPLYVNTIREQLIDVKKDGSFRLNMHYFDYCTGLRMTGKSSHELFDRKPRKRDEPISQMDMDLCRSIQEVVEEVVLRMTRSLRQDYGIRNLCLAGGVALNCVANGKILREGRFDKLWIQPATGDAGGAVGAALAAYHLHAGKPRVIGGADLMRGSFLGPKFGTGISKQYLDELGASYLEVSYEEMIRRVVDVLCEEKVVGWFQGRMEFGPRALGARSVLGDPRSKKMQSLMNLKIKFRKSFRPFAPAVLAERVSDYFDLEEASPYMLLVAPVKKSRRVELAPQDRTKFGIELLHIPKSDIPAVTHVDCSARVQTVHSETNDIFHKLLLEFDRRTSCAVVVNTSFNVRGEPIVCDPQDAYRCFMRTEMDVLAIENLILYKDGQAPASVQPGPAAFEAD